METFVLHYMWLSTSKNKIFLLFLICFDSLHVLDCLLGKGLSLTSCFKGGGGDINRFKIVLLGHVFFYFFVPLDSVYWTNSHNSDPHSAKNITCHLLRSLPQSQPPKKLNNENKPAAKTAKTSTMILHFFTVCRNWVAMKSSPCSTPSVASRRASSSWRCSGTWSTSKRRTSSNFFLSFLSK